MKNEKNKDAYRVHYGTNPLYMLLNLALTAAIIAAKIIIFK